MRSRGSVALIATMLLAACGGSDSTTAPVLPPPAPPPNPDRDADGLLNEVDACPDQAEVINNVYDSDGCPDAPLDLYLDVFSDVEAFWEARLASGTIPYRFISSFEGYTAPTASPCGQLSTGNAFYCSENEGVYYDSNLFGLYLSEVGDMAPAFIISHEIGHHVSNVLLWFTDPRLSKKDTELQADCFGGAWAANANSRGLLQEGDLEEAVIALFSIGSPDYTWFDPTVHGTSAQRIWAFSVGWELGAAGCTTEDFIYAFPT